MSASERAVLLDLDGVLVDNVAFDESVMHGMVSEFSRAARCTLASAKAQIRSLLDRRAGSPEYYDWERLSEALGLGDVWWQLHGRWRSLLRPIHGCIELVRELAHLGYSLYVASDGIRPVVDFKLGALGIGGFMKGAYSQSEIGLVKTSPEYFVRICSHIAVRPDHCVLVDNRPVNLIASARTGMMTVWFRNVEHLLPPEELPRSCSCDAVVDNHFELLAAVLDLTRNV